MIEPSRNCSNLATTWKDPSIRPLRLHIRITRSREPSRESTPCPPIAGYLEQTLFLGTRERQVATPDVDHVG